MNLSIDLSQILRTYESMKDEITQCTISANSLSLREARDQLILREMQLKTVIEISEKIIKHVRSGNRPSSGLRNNEEDIYKGELHQKYTQLEKLYANSEETLKRARSEIKNLKTDIQKLEKCQGSSNLFTVEVYQSEIDDLKKEYTEKVTELQKQLEELQSKSMPRQLLEVKRKYGKCKEQLLSTKRKFKEFEDLIAVNNEQKKIAEEKYNLLVKTHKEMFSYIEKLECKVKMFQDRHKKSRSSILNDIPKDLSLSSSPKGNDESQCLENLSVAGPNMVFSI